MGPPNIVIFLTDDQGYGDLSCMGATDCHTPHLDSLAAAGARFTNWYANSPVCPTFINISHHLPLLDITGFDNIAPAYRHPIVAQEKNTFTRPSF